MRTSHLLSFLAFAGCAPEGPDAAALLSVTDACTVIAGTQPLATDIDEDDRPSGLAVDLCALDGAVWWRADLDVDCDGGQDAACKADASYQPETAATTAEGDPLDASTVPFVVVPLPWYPSADRSSDFYWCDQGLSMGGPVAVVYGDVVAYGVIGDEGPVTDEPVGADGECAGEPFAGGVVGEASYAMAEALGIDPDPNTGGVECGDDGACPVTYILFEADPVEPIEDPEAAERTGIGLARTLTGMD
jgi:hypothetical protein